MKYKHTIEILTKDIQDAEKMIRSFRNYEKIPAIELDLAMSKLRNLYEVLSLLRNNDSEGSEAQRNPQISEKEPESVDDSFTIEQSSEKQEIKEETSSSIPQKEDSPDIPDTTQEIPVDRKSVV